MENCIRYGINKIKSKKGDVVETWLLRRRGINSLLQKTNNNNNNKKTNKKTKTKKKTNQNNKKKKNPTPPTLTNVVSIRPKTFTSYTHLAFSISQNSIGPTFRRRGEREEGEGGEGKGRKGEREKGRKGEV